MSHIVKNRPVLCQESSNQFFEEISNKSFDQNLTILYGFAGGKEYYLQLPTPEKVSKARLN